MPEGATNFDAAMTKLAEFHQANPDKPAPSLLVHSMGSIVLATAIQTYGWRGTAEHRIFSNVLLSEPDADSQGHALWLSKLGAIERVYVTQNSDDSVLKKSTDARTPRTNLALGLTPVPPLAPNVAYIDMTQALKKTLILGAHQIFKKSWMGGNVGSCVFVTRSLRGDSFDVSALPNVVSIGVGRFRIAKNKQPRHECFADADAWRRRMM